MRKPSLRSWWGRLALRAKTVVVAGVPLLVLLIATPILYTTQRSASDVSVAVEHTYRLRQQLAAVLQDLVDAETGVRGFLLTNDARFLQPYRDGVDNLPQDLGAIRRQLSGSAQSRARLRDLEALVQQRLAILERVRRFAERTPAGATPLNLLARGKLVGDEIRGAIGAMDAIQARVLVDRRHQLEVAQRLSFVVSVVVVPLALLGTIMAVLLFATGLVRRVRRIEENAGRLERGEPLLETPRGEDELARLDQALAHAAARLAEQDAELRELALVDPLTGLHNRRSFLEIADHELQVAQRSGSVAALLFIDVDGLKRVNDERGHAEGDRLLCATADLLRETLRSSDVLARIGGDEFVVLLSRDTAMEGAEVLDRLELAAEGRNEREDLGFTLSFSIGLAIFDPASPLPIERLIELADDEMYQQKRIKRTKAQTRAFAPGPRSGTAYPSPHPGSESAVRYGDGPSSNGGPSGNGAADPALGGSVRSGS